MDAPSNPNEAASLHPKPNAVNPSLELAPR